MPRFAVTVFLSCFLTLSSFAKVQETTLSSGSGDKITIRYQVSENNGQVSIVFTSPSKNLSWEHQERYDLQKVKIVCFDKNGGHSDDQFVSEIATEALMINSDKMSYQWSEDGVVWIEDQSSLNLTLLVPEATLSIPVYLAYYEKPHRYSIFARCGTLVIPLEKGKQSSGTVTNAGPTTKTRTITTTEEVEQGADLSDKEIALMLVDRIRELLGQSSASELPDGLGTYEDQLRKLELTITDKDAKAKIASVLKQIEDKKKEVDNYIREHQEDEEDDNNQKAVTAQAKQNLSYVNDRLDNIDKLTENDVAELKAKGNELRQQSYAVSDTELANDMRSAADRCDEEVKKVEDSKKRRNIWMIVGGILLAIAMFFGNQTFQHFRNLKSQRGLEAMQDKIARRAENEAKRRAQSVVRNKVSRMKGQVRQKTRDTIRDGVNKGVDTVTNGKIKKGGITI